MKRFYFFLLCSLLLLPVTAQNEQDFASRFMELYAKGTTMQCKTVSPSMMERILNLPMVEENKQTQEVLSQLKSIRVISHQDTTETDNLYTWAVGLAKQNVHRYQPYKDKGRQRLYIRRHKGKIVEIVLLARDKRFTLVNLTGNMSQEFLEQMEAI